MPPTRPGPPRHDPAWFTCIPPRSLCASGHNDARVDDAAPRADQHLAPSSKPESKPNPAPDGLLPAHRCPPGQLLHAPQTRAKTENPIGQHPRPAASCFGGYRTPAGARFPSHTRTFRLTIGASDNGHSLSAIFPVSPPRTAHFAKEQSGTDSEKAGDPDDRWRDRPATVPLWVHLEERPRLAGHAAHAKNSNSVTGLSARSSAMQRQTVRKSGPDDCSVPHRRFLERLK